MGQISRVLLVFAVLEGCVGVSHQLAPDCFVAAPAEEPRWIRIAGGGADTTGIAEVGLYGATVLKGRWWRDSGDSLRVDAAGPSDVVLLRLRIRGDSAIGEAETRTDVFGAPRAVRSWRGSRERCPKQ